MFKENILTAGFIAPSQMSDGLGLMNLTNSGWLSYTFQTMRLSHVAITMPKGSEQTARAFYGKLLGLPEIAQPQQMRDQGNLWFDAGGADLHISIEEDREEHLSRRHFALECDAVDQMRERLALAGIEILAGSPAPWKRFFVRDPFGNRIEIHEVGGLKAK